MCCCEKPNVNGQLGYRWNSEALGTHPVNPPTLEQGDVLVYDEPGRCGGQDSHSFHYRVVKNCGSLDLLVRHGGGDERIRLSNGKILLFGLELLDTARYWTLNAIFHAHSRAQSNARAEESVKWQRAIAEKKVKVSRKRGMVNVRIVSS